jgi:hypothetical protein
MQNREEHQFLENLAAPKTASTLSQRCQSVGGVARLTILFSPNPMLFAFNGSKVDPFSKMNQDTSPPPCCDAQEFIRYPVCEHLFDDWRALKEKGTLPFHIRLPSDGSSRELVCAACGAANSPARNSLCFECFEGVALTRNRRLEDLGPPVVDRDAGLELNAFPLPFHISLQSVTPLEDSGDWLAVTSDWRVIRFRSDSADVEQIVQLPGIIPLDGPVGILADKAGSIAAVFEECGSMGAVIELAGGRVTMSLDRGDYHAEQCRFPLAFLEHGGRTLLVHATDWNRLDISDPRTGKLLTARSSPRPATGQTPPHYLDYFHCGLTISPGGRWITSNGWIWHPWGVLGCWDLGRWLAENVWESEDGPSRVALCEAAYYWDRPVCWLDEHRIAWWGVGDDSDAMVSAIVIHDRRDGSGRVISPGPFGGGVQDLFHYRRKGVLDEVFRSTGDMVFDRWLFAWKPRFGLSGWDLSDGTRVLHKPDIVPAAYHRGRREFLCRPSTGWASARFTRRFDD